MAEKNKLSIISMSGDFDKVIAVFTLASGAAAIGYEVNIFFTFWGLNSIKKVTGRSFIGSGFLARFFNFLLGGRKSLPLSRLNFGGLSPLLMTGMMREKNVATLEELFDASKALRVNFYACEMAMHVLSLKKDDFIPEVKDVLGVASFLELSKGGQTLFI
jgi:peroxiredoxin family protein